MTGTALPGGRFADPVRDGDTVDRLMGPGAPNVHALLRHLEQQEFLLAPRVMGVTDDRRREILSFLPGTPAHPPHTAAVRSERALRSAGRAIRQLHDATIGFRPPEPGRWAVQDVAMPVAVDCIGHGDLTLGNLLFDGDQVVGIIDFDTAAPSNRIWDLAYLAHWLVPLHPEEDLPNFGWKAAPDRARRLRILAAAYDPLLKPARLLDLAALRLLSIGAHIAGQADAGNPAYAVHAKHDYPAGYRRATAYILGHREQLLAPPRHRSSPV